MSFGTLDRVLKSTQPIIDAAADYKKDRHPVAQILKIIFTLGGKAAWDYFYNVPAKRESVEELNRKLKDPPVSYIVSGKQVETRFTFEGVRYRAIDIDFYNARTREIRASDLGVIDCSGEDDVKSEQEQYVLARVDTQGLLHVVGVYDGSISGLAMRASSPPPSQMVIPKPLDGPVYQGW